jgi:hypothetical protein
MPNVCIEARSKGRPKGSAIDDYVVEDHSDHVRGKFKTQHEAIEWARKMAKDRSSRAFATRMIRESPLTGALSRRFKSISTAPCCCDRPSRRRAHGRCE